MNHLASSLSFGVLVGAVEIRIAVQPQRHAAAAPPSSLPRNASNSSPSSTTVAAAAPPVVCGWFLFLLSRIPPRRGCFLTPRSFNLGGKPLTVTVEAAYSKRRRMDTIPLHPEVAERVRTYIALHQHEPEDQLFDLTVARRLKIDTRAAIQSRQWVDGVWV